MEDKIIEISFSEWKSMSEKACDRDRYKFLYEQCQKLLEQEQEKNKRATNRWAKAVKKIRQYEEKYGCLDETIK